MADDPEEARIPRELLWLKRLVQGLTVVMIAGFLVLIAALVIRLGADPLPLPDRLDLPEGARATAFTQGTDWVAVVTDADEILVYDRATGALRQRVMLKLDGE